jgi:anti-sigma factor (TIGR02949 family)
MTAMKCTKIEDQADLYLDGQMDQSETEAFRKHLGTCRACAAFLANRAAVRQRMRTVARNVEIPAELGERVRMAVSREAAKRNRFDPLYGRTLLAIAAGLLITAGFYYWPSRDLRPAHVESKSEFIARVSAAVPPIMRVGLAQHVHCGVFREYPQDPPKLIDLAREEGASPALVNALESHTPEGCHVVMAHRCSYNGRTFTHLIARGDDHLMSLLITRRDTGDAFEKDLKSVADEVNTPIFAAQSDAYSVAAFETPEYLVYLVSDFDAAENLKAMEAMTPSLRAALL